MAEHSVEAEQCDVLIQQHQDAIAALEARKEELGSAESEKDSEEAPDPDAAKAKRSKK